MYWSIDNDSGDLMVIKKRSDDRDGSHVVVPDHLEEVFLVRGPRIFGMLVQECGGKIRAGQIAKVSHSTMSRWVNTKPGTLFGHRRDMRCYRSMWFGYPSPFPGFDRITEEIFGHETSFLGVSVQARGLPTTMRWLRGIDGFGLEMLDVPAKEIIDASNAIGIPAATRRRWDTAVLYPKQWRGLDNMSMHVLGTPWITAVLDSSTDDSLPRKVSHDALSCMVGMVI